MDIIGGLLHVVLLFLWILGALSYDNIALKKPASQSSSGKGLRIDPPAASRANDGNRANVDSMKDNSCIHTQINETQAWWRVDLGDIHWIDQVYITYRDWRVGSDTSAGRLAGFSIYVSDTENWWDGHHCYKNEEKPLVTRTGYPCNAIGRYVTIYNDRNATDAPFPNYYYNPTTDKAVLELCEVEIDGCSSGTFGSNCNQKCSSNCATRDTCTYNNGTCLYGCDPGFYLPDCSSSCSANCYNNTCERSNGDCIGGCKTGYYTPTCSNKCPDTCKNNECEQSTGNCVTCKAGWKGEKCDQPKCDAGKYGSDCAESCPNCGGNGRCDFTTGVCTSGCDDGYHGTKCLLLCSVNCGGNGACNITTAACIGECKAGWVGQTCVKEGCAQAGYYGTDCTTPCPNCGGDGNCEFKTGKCIYGCKVGWIGDMCSENGCEDNKYGQSCSEDCPENCGGDGACDFDSGNCPQSIGCKDGWTGDKCDNVCPDNKYGKGCNQQCGTCYNVTCNHITGICPYGCLDGWKGSTCDLVAEEINVTGGSMVPAIGGAIGGLFVILIVVVVVVIIVKKRRATDHPSSKNDTAVSYSGGNLLYQNMNEINEMNNAEISKRPLNSERQQEPAVQPENHIEDDNTYYNSPPPVPKVGGTRVADFKAYLNNKKAKNALVTDFQAIPYGAIHPHTIGESPENKPKNRFKTTFPYDHSIVKLDLSSGKSDYINANYIDSVSEPSKYIATQGPIKTTIVDFWRMVWEQNVGKIVMLTNLKEGIKVKCEQYWPNANKPMMHGNYELKLADERIFSYYVLREIDVENKKTRQVRHVLQLHFTTWPDHGTPDPLLLVIFQRRVTKLHTRLTGPTLVHCSAGIGRTGTYMALDALLEYSRENQTVDVAEYVKKMRANRMNMIQNADQYAVLHDALLEAFQTEDTSIKMDNFREEWEKMTSEKRPKNQQRLKKEIEKLNSLRVKHDQEEYASARENENRGKNRGNVLAMDKYRPYLSSFAPGGTNYINALLLPSLVSLKAFIVTQLPFQSTVSDFWRLINDHESSTIVHFEKGNDEKVQFYPEGSNKEFVCEVCSVKAVSALDMNEGVTELKYKAHYKETDEEKEVNLYKVQMDKTSLPNTTQIFKVVELVENWQREKGTGPCTVVSHDGTTPCDVFCTVMSNIQRLRIDNEVDIFQNARLFLQRRPELFKTMESYSLCYEAINAHLSTDSVYFNS